MLNNKWLYTLSTSNGRTVFSRDGNLNAKGLAVDNIKFLLDQLVPDSAGIITYTEKLEVVNEWAC